MVAGVTVCIPTVTALYHHVTATVITVRQSCLAMVTAQWPSLHVQESNDRALSPTVLHLDQPGRLQLGEGSAFYLPADSMRAELAVWHWKRLLPGLPGQMQ